jgi:hypothetical protein
MDQQVNKIVTHSWYQLHNIRSIRKYLSQDVTKIIIHALVTSKLDLNNSLLYVIPESSLKKLQTVQNNAARLIVNANKYSSAYPILKALHWLPIKFRIEFKILLLTFKAIHNQTAHYISQLISLKVPARTLRHNTGILLNEVKTRTHQGDRAFSAIAPRLWNKLPASI